jgi:hypothetical protein
VRTYFVSRLALLLVAGFLVVATQVWSGGTLEWLFIVGGIVMLGLAAIGMSRPPSAQRPLDALLAVLGIWSIVEAIVFENAALEWVSFATAIVGAAIAAAGLVLHELTTERVVHELSVTSAERRPQAAFPH